MGQNPSQAQASTDYSLVQELAVGNIVKHHKTQELHFLKEYSFTAQEAYQNALNMHSLKLANKNQHILNFQHFTTKSQNSFCSTFHKIVLIFEYIDYSLEAEMNTRIKEQRPFTEKEMWSVLCSCVLAAVHLIHTEGRMHCGLTPKDIRLTSSGCVKLLSHEMIGIEHKHDQSQGKPRMLASTLIQCLMLERLSNQNKEYLDSLIENLDCSRDMKQILSMMTNSDMKFTELEEHLFKLVQEEESMASHSNTPVLKSQSPLNSNYKCPRIYRQDYAEDKQPSKNCGASLVEPCQEDPEDYHQSRFILESQLQDQEIPDQTDSDNQQKEEEEEQPKTSRSSPQKINSFFLRERKNDENMLKEQSQTVKSQERRQQYHFSKNDGQENLFTDPKLFSLIQSDLEQIKMRKSLADLASYNSGHSNHSKNGSTFSQPTYEKEKQINKKPIIASLDQKILAESSSITSLNEVQMIKQCSRESREEDKDEELPANEGPLRRIDNILSNPEIDFKKKPIKAKKDVQNYSPPFQNKQTTPISIYENILAASYPEKKQIVNYSIQKNQVKQESSSQKNSTSKNSQQSNKKEDLVSVNEKYNRGRYQGTKLNGKRHGFGTFYYSEGGKYVGNWSQNKMHGKGTLFYPNKKIAYEGQWENDQLSGYGTLYNEEVAPLRNPFDYRDFSDVEDFWTKYEGEFYQDNKEGKGKLYLVNGERLQATFKEDKVDGQGILFRGDGTFVKGKWRQNQLVGLF